MYPSFLCKQHLELILRSLCLFISCLLTVCPFAVCQSQSVNHCRIRHLPLSCSQPYSSFPPSSSCTPHAHPTCTCSPHLIQNHAHVRPPHPLRSEQVLAPPATDSATLRATPLPPPAKPPTFRVTTYNILAHQYADMVYSQTVLFRHCPLPHLDMQYRKQLLLKEILSYNTDLLLLQEVDEDVFDNYFHMHLSDAGFGGYHVSKASNVREGCATFWREGRYREVARERVVLR